MNKYLFSVHSVQGFPWSHDSDMDLQKFHKELWEITTNVAALVCIVVILAPSVGRIIGALECGPRVLHHTGIDFQQPLETPGRSTGRAHTLLYTRCPWWHLAAGSSSQLLFWPPSVSFNLPGSRFPLYSHHFVWLQVVLFVQVVQEGQLLLHGGQVHPQIPVHPSGEAALQLVALSRHQGGAEALIGWSCSQCQLGKRHHRWGKIIHNVGGKRMMWDREVPTANTPRTTHPWYRRRVFPYALSARGNRQNC